MGLRPLRLLPGIVLVVSGCATAGRADGPKRHDDENAASFRIFNERIQEYARRQKAAEAAHPAAKVSDQPELIVARQQELAKTIREARPEAHRGDIFTEDIGESFRHVIRRQFQGPTGSNIRATLSQGDPLKAWQLAVNQPYPATVPSTTVPPSLLLNLPELPEGVSYRIVGRDLVLLDAKANLVIDVLVRAIP